MIDLQLIRPESPNGTSLQPHPSRFTLRVATPAKPGDSQVAMGNPAEFLYPPGQYTRSDL